MGTQSKCRSLADLPLGFNATYEGGHSGSVGMMTRARRRRLLAESSERLGTKRALVHPVVAGPREWRHWANLVPDLVEEIAGRLLALDVAEYLRFRAVCKPWRDLTDDPRARGALDSRFRPRNWMVLSIIPDAGPRRRLLNLATAASIGVHLPALSTHCHLCVADGLLVLFHRATKAIRLLDPLSNAVTDLPTISCIVPGGSPSVPDRLPAVFRDPRGISTGVIDGAGFDDSTSPPTLLLCLRDNVSNIVLAKPGDAYWTLLSPGQARYRLYDWQGRALFCSLLSLGGRCYVTTPEGSVYVVELRPLPRLVAVVDQRHVCAPDTSHLKRILSFLVAGGDGRMLMVRYWRNIEHFGGSGAYKRTEVFTLGGITGRMELLEVDIAGRRLLSVQSLGRHAVFIGTTHCVLISTETFPSVATDAIYLGYGMQFSYLMQVRFSVYHLNNSRRKTEPPHEFCVVGVDKEHRDRRIVPCARPCNLDEYLVCYVDRRHKGSYLCINHTTHCRLERKWWPST
ncbi:uncharacterized protein LOC133905081 [Phragmites australis]|uniref:uncharacterized protein LOC133905081 n=1 Tax=Phragmites australis TaxID=29695 RepID=UPI002D774099|nr:uncharacterized protein LOC133905081 [Phragmites australis]